MPGQKTFFHDRLILLLMSINAFLVLASSLLLLYQLVNATSLQSLWSEYRTNLGPIDKYFKPGGVDTYISFIIFMVLTFVFHIIIGRKVYHLRRQFAVLVMSLGTLLILLSTLVSNALLGL